jgi:DNA processing protein
MMYEIKRYNTLEIFPDLEHVHGAPKTVDVVGNIPEVPTLISFVGSRDMTSYGRQVIQDIIPGLAKYQVAIVSGLAFGVDHFAHRIALDNNIPCIAIPGSGLAPSSLYPAEHRDFAHELVDRGGVLISPFPPEQRGIHWTFPVRNRLIAAISDMTIVVEAKHKSGSLITAECALDIGRKLGAVPGSIYSSNSDGTNALIAAGATMIRSIQDIVNEFGWDSNDSQSESNDYQNISPDELDILKQLGEPKTRSDIARALSQNIHEISITLTMMELRGLIRENGGYIERRK